MILKLIKLGWIALLTGCATLPSVNTHPHMKRIAVNEVRSKKMLVRLTVYWRHGRGSDHWTRHGKAATGRRLVNARSAAVDPRVIPYYSKLKIKGLKNPVIAVDTGGAVKKRTASRRMGKDCPVVDIFFSNRSSALRFNKRNADFQMIEVYYKVKKGNYED